MSGLIVAVRTHALAHRVPLIVVALSVPAIYFYAVFRNRISTITTKTTLIADDQLRSIARLAKGGKAPAAS